MNEFEIDKHEVRRAFSRAAADYDAAAVLQREVCARMLERLDYVKLQPARILDAGCGTGWGARQLAQRYPAARVVALDIAIGMLHAARSHAGWRQRWFGGAGPVQLCGDIEALPLAADSVEMVWSNLALQWCNDLPAAFAGLHRVLKTEGMLMFSSFGPDTLKELRQAFHGVDGYNHLNRFADMHDVGDMLMQAGFAEPVMDMEYMTLTYDDVRGVLDDLKRIGAHNATAGRSQGLTGKAKWAHMLENYERLRRDGKLPATYEVVYGHAWKPQPRVAQDGAGIIRTPFKL
ncbi:MAG: malonyl-[acyl-carrier protein] O-methyltransferase BioC [Gallionellales bacterium GWA2_60_18]|nr:MAG: malonyl-[acyl-carrier protein] O-methyltransferase BioC [Gallionellales bacterium GWA2_60_18]